MTGRIRPAHGTSPAQHAAVRQALSVVTASSLYGVSFGALSVASGLSVLHTCLLSLLLFSAGSQFALIGILGGGGTAVATAPLLGARNSLYGLQLGLLLGLGGGDGS